MININRHPSFENWFEEMAARSKQQAITIIAESKKLLETQHGEIEYFFCLLQIMYVGSKIFLRRL